MVKELECKQKKVNNREWTYERKTEERHEIIFIEKRQYLNNSNSLVITCCTSVHPHCQSVIVCVLADPKSVIFSICCVSFPVFEVDT